MAADVFVSCAETSGDMHAGGLVRNLLRLRPQLRVEAVGGGRLRAAGATVLHDSVARATFGLRAFGRAGEVWRMLRALRRRWRRDGPPRVVVACDSWTMNKHVLALARGFGCRTMYYVSPQVWASRPGRARRMAALTDAVACILPFEEAWLRERGVNATFVGHPLFDDLPATPPKSEHDGPPRVAVNFGSRLGTARANLPGMLAVVGAMRRAVPGVTFATPVVPATAALVRGHAGGIEIRDDFDAAVAGCDLALTVSGTSTLHTAAHGVPMVVVYRANRPLWETLGRRIITTRTFALVNLLHPRREHVVPEFVPWFGDPRPVADAAISLLTDPAARADQRARLAEVVDPLRGGGAGERAARMALALMG